MLKILLIDDDKELCQLLSEYLSNEGFAVDMIHDGQQAVELTEQAAYSLIVLDVMLPVRSGFDVLKILRQHSQTPVIMLTAKGDTVDRVIGLEIGADDYLAKPCDPRELVARIRAILRRASIAEANQPNVERLTSGKLSLHLGTRTATWDNQDVVLTGTEFSVLEILVRRAGQVISKDDMTEQALNRKLTPYDRSIDVHVSNIRKKIALAGSTKDLIINVRGAGYMLTLNDEQ
ncbi:response regulator transcription factor [Cellvibrio japonicus]|uniref:AbfR arabinofuranosidase two component system response regulator n=1 Tax=Cellvibrio japonicus (strain Ueda107) TaxID=498211 RepID=B3PFT8_CELJU|nr:response regulator transcription factor [Cellvibrio japonicus]ACE84843.1 abfR arabinofuranosidase two component system response regulator [Cellvibrio japonicus Ueda107]QEI12305.1 response regulator transcription factor [Cellvibrio japonicus]QEI15879.1 response regulator transcription factor [Cellvibrio japonicus]QEI19457.1 response regulator transcription factor [Cellvibrio japonicus]